MKKNFLLLLVLLLMIGMCGCGMGRGSKSERVKNHLAQKYDDTFEIDSFWGRNIDMPHDELVCRDSNGVNFHVYIKNEGGKEVIVDEYYGVLIAEDYRDMVCEIFDEYIPEYKLFSKFTASYFDNDFDKNTKIEDAIPGHEPQFFSNNCIFVKRDLSELLTEDMFNDLSKAMEEKGLFQYIAIYEIDEAEYDLMDEEKNVNEYLSIDCSAELIFKQTIN